MVSSEEIRRAGLGVSGRSISFLTSAQRLQVARADTLLPREKRAFFLQRVVFHLRPGVRRRTERCRRRGTYCRGAPCPDAARRNCQPITPVAHSHLHWWRQSAWLGISDSNCRIRPRATQLDLHDNFAGGRRKSGGGDPSRTSCVAPPGRHSQIESGRWGFATVRSHRGRREDVYSASRGGLANLYCRRSVIRRSSGHREAAFSKADTQQRGTARHSCP